jgi:hypothetical protein
MDLILAILQTACYLAGALALATERWRRPATALLLLTALLSVAAGLLAPGERELVCTHTFVGREGNALDLSPVHFPTATMRAPGWLWPLPFAAFAAAAAAAVCWRRTPPRLPPMVAALLFAWSATASWIAMQFAAAPAAVVQPFGLERLLWPAGLLLTLDLARGGGSFLRVFLMLSLGLVAQRLPAALFSKLASDHGWGTGLDVAQVVKIVNPMTHLQFEPRLQPNSPEQQFWLIWAEHVLVYPALYLLGFAGIAFASFMIQKHDRMTE